MIPVKIDDRRTALRARISELDHIVDRSQREIEQCAAQLEALDFAVEAMTENEPAQVAPAADTRKRRNVRQIVLDRLEATGPCTVEEIVAGCEIRKRLAESAVHYWIGKGRILAVDGGRYHVLGPDQAPRAADTGAHGHQADHLLALFAVQGGPITMATFNENGILGETVYHAEKDGLIEVHGKGYRLKPESAAAA